MVDWPQAILLTCIAVFIACAVCALIVLALTSGKRRRHSPVLAACLMASFLGAVLSAAGALAANSYAGGLASSLLAPANGGGETREAEAAPPAAAAQAPETASPDPEETAPPAPGDKLLEAGFGPPTGFAALAPDGELARWAIANLPPRPAIPGNWQVEYPSCANIERLRGTPQPELARACLAQMQRFNAAVLVPYGQAYEAYVAALEQQAARQGEGPLLDLLREEYASYTTRSQPETRAYDTLSRMWTADREALRSRAR